MRSYVFTEAEVECLVEWLGSGKETESTVKTLSRIRRNVDRLSAHLDLMFQALGRM